MSSFVIDRKEYAKAAGVVAGIAKIKRDFWCYDYSVGRNMNEGDYFRRFLECYEMNALSVKEQYNDDEMEGTPASDNECKAAFLEGKKKGTAAIVNGNIRQAVSELIHFFRSAMYQTEKEAYYYKMKMFLDGLSVELVTRCVLPPAESWGELEL